jgi:HPt (histidine-containing phosphotransfer) domain-containing protein
MKEDTNKSSSDGTSFPAWLEGDKKLLKGITAIFIKNVPPQMTQLKEALEGNDAAQVKILSHSLKGSASMIGAQALRDAAFKVESAALEGNLEEALGFYSAMQSELDNVLKELDKTQ